MTNVLSYINNFKLKKHEDTEIKIIVSQVDTDIGCKEILSRLFLNGKLTGFIFVLKGNSEALSKHELMKPFLVFLKDRDKETPIFCLCGDAFPCRIVKTDIYKPIEYTMLQMMRSCCHDIDECDIVHCGCLDGFSVEKKINIQDEINKFWKHSLISP